METNSAWWKRPFLTSARALMVTVFLLALVFGWFAQGAQVQREAVAAIRKTGGSVVFDWERLPNGMIDRNRKPPWPEWIIGHLGPEHLNHVVIANLGLQATDVEMEQVGRLLHLEGVRLTLGSEVTDAGLAHLRGLVRLEHITLAANLNITGASLANLTGLSRLKALHLDHLDLSDADLFHLEGLANLQDLNLSHTRVTDAGLAHLERLVNLREIRLVSTHVEGAGLAHLRRMDHLEKINLIDSRLSTLSSIPALPKLKVLLLDRTPIDDAGLAGLPRLEALEILVLSETRIMDDGLNHLAGCKALKTLGLGKTAVTSAGMTRLRKVLPELNLAEEVSVTKVRTRPDTANPKRAASTEISAPNQ